MRISDWSQTCALPISLREHFEDRYPGAIVWLNTSRDLAKQKCPKEAAFLHQATERIYAGLLLTLTYYKSYHHHIAFLRSLAQGPDRRPYGIWTQAPRPDPAMPQQPKQNEPAAVRE